jgi:hypothetical protein
VGVENQQSEEELDDVGIVQITQQQHDRGFRNGRILKYHEESKVKSTTN